MASIVSVDNIRATGTSTNAITIDSSNVVGEMNIASEGGSASTSLQQGLAKVWNRVDTSTTIVDSFNVASVTDDGTGDTDTNFTSSMNNATFSTTGDINYHNNGITWHRSQATGLVNTRQYIPTASNFYDLEFGIHIMGDLA